ncbi:MAG: 5(3)-deoxyribonucleotidase [Clostridia bacterium]|nr:5(3)-deoxyribonucleotidase [Clostridia bacterium]
MIDMDDVICHGGFLYLVNKFTNKNYVIEDFANYYMQDIIPDENKEKWLEFFANNNMYEKAYFIGNAREIIEKLNKEYELFIVTAYIIKDKPSISGRLLKDKFEWLQTNLPFISQKNYIFTDHKEFIDFDIKIDDKLSNLEGNAKTKLLFTAYHNKNFTDEYLNSLNVKRVDNWDTIKNILL